MSTVRTYELIYIAPPEASEELLAELHQLVAGIVEQFKGTITSTDNWGRRKLAYEIAGQREGVYVLEVIDGPPELHAELDRRLKVADQVMRHMVIRVDEEQQAAERIQARRKEAVAARRARRGLPAEPEAPVAQAPAAESGAKPATEAKPAGDTTPATEAKPTGDTEPATETTPASEAAATTPAGGKS
jgi:small subunit ribosomal protein S6